MFTTIRNFCLKTPTILFVLALILSGCAGSTPGTVTKTTQSINLTLGTVTYGISPITLPASVPSSGLPINYTVSGPATVSNDILTITGAGQVTVTASQPGSATYSAATATVTFTVNKAMPGIVWATPAGIGYGTALSATQLDATSTAAGTLVYTPAAGAVLSTGSQTLSVTLTPSDTTDYMSATDTVTLVVSRTTPPTIIWTAPAATTYGTPLSATQLDATTSVAGTFVYSPAAGTVLTAGSQTLSVIFTPTDTTDYPVSTASVNLTVNKATPTITWTAPTAISYGTALSATQLNATSSVAGTFVYTPAAGTVLGAGNQTLSTTFTPTDVADYSTATVSVSLAVTKASSVTITWATPSPIIYGTTLSTTQLNATASVPGTFLYSPASGTVLGVGTQTLSVTFTPTDATDYNTATANVSLVVTKGTPTITWTTPSAITYGTSLTATQLDATASVPGTFVYSPAAGIVLGAGTQQLGVTFTPTDTTDYSAATMSVNLTTNKVGLILTANSPSMIFGTSVPALTYTLTGFVNGDTPAVVTGTTTPMTTGTSMSPVGTYPITITQGTLTAVNYTFTPVNGLLTITGGASQILTFNPLPNQTYGVAPILLMGTTSSPLPISYTTTGPATVNGSTLTVTGAGSVTVTANQVGDTTYAAAAPVSQSFMVATVPLTVTAQAATRIYGAVNPTFSATMTGFVNSDTQATATAGAPSLTTAATTLSAVGSYPITAAVGTLTSANYTFTFSNSTLTITQAPLAVTANSLSRAYGAANPTLTYAIAGFVNSDTQTTATTGIPALSTTATAASTVGAYPITATQGTLAATNYSFSFVNGALTLTQATPVITWATPAAITYGSALSGTQLDATASTPGTFIYTPTMGTVLNVASNQTLSVTFTPTDVTDYTSASKTVTLVVGQSTPTITWATPAAIIYGTTLSATQLNATASVPGTFIYNPAAATTPAIGNDTLSATFTPTDAVNYTTATATVTLTVELVPQTITFPAPTPAKTFTVSATSDSGLLVTFSSTSPSCTVVGTTVTEILSGDCLIEADAAGNSVYAAAAPAFQDVTIGQTVALVSVSPSGATLAPGVTQQFTATATDQFNQPMLSVPTFTWATGSAAGIDQTGLYTAINTGDTTLTDTVTASTAGITSAPAAITLSPAAPILTIVNLAPQTPTINAPNGTANFSTTAQDQFGRPYVPAPTCTYSSSNLLAATIAANGQATATNTGTSVATTTITAVCGSFTQMTLLTVNPAPYIKTLTVAPVTVNEYSATSVNVTATDEYGNPFPILPGQITLGSFNSTYVSVAVSNSPTPALNIGGVEDTGATSTPVTISVGNVSTTFNVTVVDCLPNVCYTPVLTSITVTPETASMEFNGTQVVTASALDQHGANFSTTFTWTSNSSFLTVDSTGKVTAVGIGSGTISASSNSVTGTSVTITITDAPYPSDPIITSLFPPMAVAKDYTNSTQLGIQPHSTAIVVNGTGFLPGAIVCFGSDCSASYTTFKSSTRLVVLVPWQDLTTAGVVNIIVQNPALVGYIDQSVTVGVASAPSVFTLTTKGFVTITFDDGYASGLTGTSLFNAQGVATTQFIITGNTCATIGTCASNGLRADGYPWGWNGVGPATGCQYASYKLPVTAAQISACSVGVGFPGYITWANVASLAAAGNEIAPHTRSHNQISLESAADVTGELQGALADLQYHAAPGHDTVAGYSITSVFAYPYGDYGCYASEVPPVGTFNTCVTGQFNDQQIGTQVKAAGYRGARTSDAALEGGLKYEEGSTNSPLPDDCSNDSCYGRADQPLFLQTITADQTAGDTCTFAGGTTCDTSASNGALPCMENGVAVAKPGFKCWVDNAVATGQWVVLLFHRIDDNTSGDKSLSVNSTEVQKLALYLKAQGITTVTLRQGLAMEGIDGQYEAVDSNGNIIAYPDRLTKANWTFLDSPLYTDYEGCRETQTYKMDNKLCVILPAKNEGRVIARTLTSLLNADVRGTDIYMIDDGSTDNTGEIGKQFGVNVMRNPVNLGKATSIAKLMVEFDLVNRYDIIALMDADTTVNPDYYIAVKKSFEDPKVATVCGRPTSAPYNHLTAWRAIGYFMTHYIYRGGQSNMNVINVAPGCASSYRSKVFKELDWSKDTLVEDMDVTIQIHRKNLGKIVYQPDAHVTTQDPRTLRDYFNQMKRWHTGTWQVSKKHHLFRGFRKIDLEFKLLMIEGLLLSIFIMFFPIGLAIWHKLFLRGFAVDAFVLFIVSVFCGIMDRRLDVVYYFPVYEFMRFVDAFVFLKSFWEISIRKRQLHSWFSVQRY